MEVMEVIDIHFRQAQHKSLLKGVVCVDETFQWVLSRRMTHDLEVANASYIEIKS